MTIHLREFDFDAWLEHVARTPSVNGSSRRSSHRNADGTFWSGTETFEDAMRLARDGWPEGLARVKDMAESIWNVIGQQMPRVDIQYDVAGAFADVDRFLTGEPEDMIQFVEDENVLGRGKVVKVWVNMSASAGVSTRTIFCRGAAVVALVDALEKLGYSCEIIVSAASSPGWNGDREVLQYDVCLRKAGDPLDLDRLAFALANSAWLRRLVFSAKEHENAALRSRFGIPGGYGCPTESRGHTSEERGIEVPSLRNGTHHWETQEAAMEWVLAAAAKVLGRPVSEVA